MSTLLRIRECALQLGFDAKVEQDHVVVAMYEAGPGGQERVTKQVRSFAELSTTLGL